MGNGGGLLGRQLEAVDACHDKNRMGLCRSEFIRELLIDPAIANEFAPYGVTCNRCCDSCEESM